MVWRILTFANFQGLYHDTLLICQYVGPTVFAFALGVFRILTVKGEGVAVIRNGLSHSRHHFTACAIATSCCISDVPSKWESQKFDPPLLPHFSTDFNETQNHERYSAYDPTCKICLMWDDGKGSAKMANFGLLLVLFCTLRVASRLHSKTDHEQ